MDWLVGLLILGAPALAYWLGWMHGTAAQREGYERAASAERDWLAARQGEHARAAQADSTMVKAATRARVENPRPTDADVESERARLARLDAEIARRE